MAANEQNVFKCSQEKKEPTEFKHIEKNVSLLKYIFEYWKCILSEGEKICFPFWKFEAKTFSLSLEPRWRERQKERERERERKRKREKLFFRQKYWQDSIELSVLRVLRGNFKLLKTNSFWKKQQKNFCWICKKTTNMLI